MKMNTLGQQLALLLFLIPLAGARCGTGGVIVERDGGPIGDDVGDDIGDDIGDGDGDDDVVDVDADGDGIYDDVDNCVDVANADQIDYNNNGVGDVCDPVCAVGEAVIPSDAEAAAFMVTNGLDAAMETNCASCHAEQAGGTDVQGTARGWGRPAGGTWFDAIIGSLTKFGELDTAPADTAIASYFGKAGIHGNYAVDRPLAEDFLDYRLGEQDFGGCQPPEGGNDAGVIVDGGNGGGDDAGVIVPGTPYLTFVDQTPNSGIVNTCLASLPVRIEMRNTDGSQYTTDIVKTIAYSVPNDVKLYLNNSCTILADGFLLIQPGDYTETFYFEKEAAGDFDITISTNGLSSATQAFTVVD